ncbi:MAG: hypothetical protein GF392_06305, partial [Candidatus Omnitrophica bacterium]|nr:hypothetical protein [Candidatus Omnitrophota bacterium]
MSRYFDPKRYCFKSAAVLMAGVILLTGCLHADSTGASGIQADDLVPTLRSAPIVKMVNGPDGITLTDAPRLLAEFSESFRDSYKFKYVSALVYDALKLDVSAAGLGYFVRHNLKGISPDGFDLNSVKKSNNSYRIPYRIDSTGELIVLLYANHPSPDAKLLRTANPASGVSPEAVFQKSPALPDIDKAISAVEKKIMSEHDKAAQDKENSAGIANGSSSGRRTHIDNDTLLKTLFFSLLYLRWNFTPIDCLYKVCSELLFVFVVAMIAHQAVYIFQLIMAGENARFMGVKFGLNGVGIEYSVESPSLSRSIVTAAMAGSAAIGSVFTILSIFYDSSLFGLMAIANAAFAFSSTDIEELRRDTDFKNAPRMIYKRIQKAMKNLLRKRYKPLIVLIGGYFASGKSIIASKTRSYLKQRTQRDVFVIGGDNWLLSNDRRESREDLTYPY